MKWLYSSQSVSATYNNYIIKMAKKLPSQTKTDHTKCMVCAYCESACGTYYMIRACTMYMGQSSDIPDSSKYYCNSSCRIAHGVQEQSIYLQKQIAGGVRNEAEIKEVYRQVIQYPHRFQAKEWTHTASSILSDIAHTKHLRLFYEGCLARKSTEELHLLRMKAKKHAGEMLEHSMVTREEKEVDGYSSILQGDLADDDNYLITFFARD